MARKKHLPTPAQDKLRAIGIDAICERVAACVPLRHIASDAGVGFAQLAKYLSHPAHAEQYARAREAQADTMADELLSIADDGTRDRYIDQDGVERIDQDVIARSRLRVDARKWLASKMAPKRYGERVQQEITGRDGGAIEIDIGVRAKLIGMIDKL